MDSMSLDSDSNNNEDLSTFHCKSITFFFNPPSTTCRCCSDHHRHQHRYDHRPQAEPPSSFTTVGNHLFFLFLSLAWRVANHPL
ncbi:hypothetical protein Scep_005460 [Stephania cephalantha]|uniref:Uncharacterized protein n=1 Tax=Stephania cephalantha TaxID=152367 RepID=A0AAP0KUB9_9MAGN